MQNNVVIAGYLRSPFQFAKKGLLSKIRPDELATQVVKGLLDKTGVSPVDVEDIIMGCAFPEGEQGYNIARNVGLLAGLPYTVAGTTVNRFCGSSMQAIHMAAGAIRMNAGEAFICAGVESMSRVPMGGYNLMPHPGLVDQFPGAYMPMGETAENLVDKYGISREQQEAFTVTSHLKADTARQAGYLDDEIIEIVDGKNSVYKDGCIRGGTTIEALEGLSPVFRQNGSVTAATSSPMTDGASATLITSESYANSNGLPIMARIRSVAVSGCNPEIMGIGPVSAIKKALQRAKIEIGDIDIFELNEAFAVQTMACVNQLGIDMDKINIDGGALALGHPLGATGARITGKAAALLKREGKRYAIASQCIGGGQGIATVLEAL